MKNLSNLLLITLIVVMTVAVLALSAVNTSDFAKALSFQSNGNYKTLYDLAIRVELDYSAIYWNWPTVAGAGQRKLQFMRMMEQQDLEDESLMHCWDAYAQLTAEFVDARETEYELTHCRDELARKVYGLPPYEKGEDAVTQYYERVWAHEDQVRESFIGE